MLKFNRVKKRHAFSTGETDDEEEEVAKAKVCWKSGVWGRVCVVYETADDEKLLPTALLLTVPMLTASRRSLCALSQAKAPDLRVATPEQR